MVVVVASVLLWVGAFSESLSTVTVTSQFRNLSPASVSTSSPVQSDCKGSCSPVDGSDDVENGDFSISDDSRSESSSICVALIASNSGGSSFHSAFDALSSRKHRSKRLLPDSNVQSATALSEVIQNNQHAADFDNVLKILAQRKQRRRI